MVVVLTEPKSVVHKSMKGLVRLVSGQSSLASKGI